MAKLLTESDLVAQGISIADQYRLRYEGKLPTQMRGGQYVYSESAVGRGAAAGRCLFQPAAALPESGNQGEGVDDAETRTQFFAAVNAFVDRGFSKARAVLAVSRRQPALYASFLKTCGAASPKQQFSAAETQTLKQAWQAAIAAEVAAGHSGLAAVLNARRKHPGLQQALAGELQ